MPKQLIDILSYLLWVVLGVGMAFLTFSTLAKSIEKLNPDSKNAKSGIVFIALGRFLRFFLVAALLFGAVKWKIWYAITFVVALTLAVWALAIWHNKKAASLGAGGMRESEVKENV